MILHLLTGFLISLSIAISMPALADETWNQLLQEHIVWQEGGHASCVDYSGLAAEEEKLQEYLESLSSTSQQDYEGWSDATQLAFLINAYNAFTLELILTRYPDLESIRDLGGFLSGPWSRDFFTLLGEKRTLDELEHEMIRRWFDEPRIHFAVNCASIGCPALRDEPYSGDRLESQLEDQEKRFISDSSRNRFDTDKNRLRVSPIFKWYGEDFDSFGGVAAYFQKHADVVTNSESAASMLQADKPRVEYLKYDWSLNDCG